MTAHDAHLRHINVKINTLIYTYMVSLNTTCVSFNPETMIGTWISDTNPNIKVDVLWWGDKGELELRWSRETEIIACHSCGFEMRKVDAELLDTWNLASFGWECNICMEESSPFDLGEQ
jgi:hypothetical protein